MAHLACELVHALPHSHIYSFPLLAGVTSLLIRGNPVLFTEALKWAESELMGSHAHQWPLTKVLDIGGVAKDTNSHRDTGYAVIRY